MLSFFLFAIAQLEFDVEAAANHPWHIPALARCCLGDAFIGVAECRWPRRAENYFKEERWFDLQYPLAWPHGDCWAAELQPGAADATMTPPTATAVGPWTPLLQPAGRVRVRAANLHIGWHGLAAPCYFKSLMGLQCKWRRLFH